MRTVSATRYVTPLREGGSLPAVVEADDFGTYVLKFRGAGQGRKALVAEVVAGELARSLGFAVPEIVLMELDAELARAEPDPEIQDLIRASGGLNLALDYLPGALGFDPLVDDPGAELASRIVWFDAFTTNVDRSPRNTNLLTWHQKLWLIDHGASLYFHHNWPKDRGSLLAAATRPYRSPYGHVLLPSAKALTEADTALSAALTPEVLRGAVALVPDEWLSGEPGFAGPDEVRDAYVEYLAARLAGPRAWVGALEDARRGVAS